MEIDPRRVTRRPADTSQRPRQDLTPFSQPRRIDRQPPIISVVTPLRPPDQSPSPQRPANVDVSLVRSPGIAPLPGERRPDAPAPSQPDRTTPPTTPSRDVAPPQTATFW